MKSALRFASMMLILFENSSCGLPEYLQSFCRALSSPCQSIGRNTSDPRIALEAAVREYSEMESVLRTWMPVLRRDPAFNRHLSLRGRRMEVEWQRSVSWDPDLPGRKRVLGMPVPGGSGEYRLSLPLSVLQEKGRLDGEIHQPTHGVLSIIEMARHAPDTLLLHTGINDGIYDALAAYREFIPEMRVVLGSTI